MTAARSCSPFDLVTARLDRFKPTAHGRGMARCPAHKDRHASLSVREFDTGAVGLHCFAGCEVESVVRAMGLQMEDLFPPRPDRAAAGSRGDPKPYTVRQLLAALSHELHVVWVLLAELAAGKHDIPAADRRRAALARERCVALIEELRSAR